MLSVTAVDLHIHTCLSPCASLDMTPRKIVRRACERALGMIAVTDHNSAENAAAVMAAARDTALCVIPGLEVTTAEEAHVLGLFAELEAALSLQEIVYRHLLPGENDEDLFGMQVVANENDEVEGLNKRLLIGATSLTVNQLVEAIHEREGLAVAA
ncbi:MAG: PHP domain-containing protein, partial [Candidatus Bipolaricaulota bacterium]